MRQGRKLIGGKEQTRSEKNKSRERRRFRANERKAFPKKSKTMHFSCKRKKIAAIR